MKIIKKGTFFRHIDDITGHVVIIKVNGWPLDRITFVKGTT